MLLRILPSNSFDLVFETDEGRSFILNIPDWFPYIGFIKRNCDDFIDIINIGYTLNPPSLLYYVSERCSRYLIVFLIATYNLKSWSRISGIERVVVNIPEQYISDISDKIINLLTRRENIKKKELIRISKKIRNMVEGYDGTDNIWEHPLY